MKKGVGQEGTTSTPIRDLLARFVQQARHHRQAQHWEQRAGPAAGVGGQPGKLAFCGRNKMDLELGNSKHFVNTAHTRFQQYSPEHF